MRNPKMTVRAKALRSNLTDAEALLWRYLRRRQMHGVKFRRQVVIEPYIVDFLCVEKKLIIEVDGGQHNERKRYDSERTRFLTQQGFKLIRFWNNEVCNNTSVVVDEISRCLQPLSLSVSNKKLNLGGLREIPSPVCEGEG